MHPYREINGSEAASDAELGGPGGIFDDSVVLAVLFATGVVLLGAAACGEPSPVAAVVGLILVACSSWSFGRDVVARKPP